ncbi:mechanosensitive ion channel family protein [Trinickia sp. YCB016]
MPNFSNAVIWGVPILLADFAVWRLSGRRDCAFRAAWRCAAFAALTWLLFANDVSPLSVPAVSGRLERFATQAVGVAWWFQCAGFVTLLLDRVLLPKSWHTQRLFHDVAAGAIFGAATVAAAGYVLGLPVSGLVATSGAMAVVFGLAIQNTLNDMFSGLVLNTTQPFQLNDWVSIGDLEGRVVESNWRATKLINSLGNLVVVPNSAAAKANIVNLSEPPNTHGITLVLNIDPEVRPAIVLEALERAAASSGEVLASPAPIVAVKTFKTNSIEYELVCYVDSLQKKTAVRNQLYEFVHRHLSAAKVGLRSLTVPHVAQTHVSHRRRLLSSVELFRHLDDEDLAPLEAALTQRHFDKGEVIYASDSDLRVLTIVESGVASVSVPGASGDAEVRRMAPGDAIGQSVVLAGAKLHATVRALTPVTAYQLKSEDLSPLISRKPELGQSMCLALTKHRAVEEKLMMSPDENASASFSLLAWLERGMKQLHAAMS